MKTHTAEAVGENEDRDGGGKNSNNNAGSFMYRRWTPTTEQIRILKRYYCVCGMRSPTAEQIQSISAKLRQYGKAEEKSVFYWFQNRKKKKTSTTDHIPATNHRSTRRITGRVVQGNRMEINLARYQPYQADKNKGTWIPKKTPKQVPLKPMESGLRKQGVSYARAAWTDTAPTPKAFTGEDSFVTADPLTKPLSQAKGEVHFDVMGLKHHGEWINIVE